MASIAQQIGELCRPAAGGTKRILAARLEPGMRVLGIVSEPGRGDEEFGVVEVERDGRFVCLACSDHRRALYFTDIVCVEAM